MTLLLLPGAGGRAWYWHRVVPLLLDAGHPAIAVDLPAADDAAGLADYTDVAVGAGAQLGAPVTVVAQSLGAFVAAQVAVRLAAARIVLLNPMVPAPAESAEQWGENTGSASARATHLARIGLSRTEFDMVEDFFHDVPTEVREEALAQPEPPQSSTPFREPWPLPAWPDIPTTVLCGRDDRLFPLDFQRAVVRDRLGLDVTVVPGGHLNALSRPADITRALLEVS
ncbi:alpha/beta fold hydrolase [Mycolicibacterium murale]|uniref:alpha/beta fold hydrolase n=1 Tax=Mycolicibacterium murale TaxID=182220 RepID=UPI0018762030|nr:alpha/beta fold hydrolase [Mycolicibacterium murale]MCV7180876.1 alpha/beta hydrolase [Mycolicibacterium murale]